MSQNPERDSVDETRELVLTRHFDAPRELVFAAWTDPVHISNWWGPKGFTTTTHSIDLRPGGAWRFLMHAPDGTEYPNRILYQEIDEPNRIVYLHDADVEDDPKQFQVTVTFAEENGGTRLTMRMLLRTAAQRDEVMKFGAVELGYQTLDRLAAEVSQREDAFVTSRVFDAPRELVYRVWTETEQLRQWWGPKGFAMIAAKNDLRPGGTFHHGWQLPDGNEMWSLWTYREIVAQERLIFEQTFSDRDGNVTRFPGMETWPLRMLVSITLSDADGKTRVTVRSSPLDASESERDMFRTMHGSLTAGWGGTFDVLGEHLAKESSR